MKKLVLSIVGLTALGLTQASAADMAARPYTKAPPYVAPVMNWSGFYIGGFGGYASGDYRDQFGSAETEGGFGGGLIGYNWQWTPSWVFGIEADIAGGDIRTGNIGGVTGTNFDARIDYFGTVRGRLGYTWDSVMLYGTGGYAYANQRINSTLRGRDDETHSGYAAGAGIEWAFAPNWTGKVEYLYMDFDRETYFGGTAAPITARIDDLHTIKVGINYRFNTPVVAKY